MEKSLGIAVRDAQPSDADDVAALLARCGLVADGSARRRLGYLLAASTSICLVAEHEGHVVGCLLSSYNGFHVFLSHIAVDEQWRGRGVGQLLHAGLLVKARELGALGIVADSWLSAVGFYYRLGYRTPGAVFLIHDVGDQRQAE